MVMTDDTNTLSGSIFDESTQITIMELRELCSIDAKLVEEMIDEGILEPIDGHRDQRRFRYSCIRRTRTVLHLQQDLGVNLPGAALALELLDRIERLKAETGFP
jgi:chaperone modulatory protein CbpM